MSRDLEGFHIQDLRCNPYSLTHIYILKNVSTPAALNLRLLLISILLSYSNVGVPQATPAAQAALEAPAKNVSVTLMAPCRFPVTGSQDSARAALEPQEGSVMAVSTGMHARAQSVSVRILT